MVVVLFLCLFWTKQEMYNKNSNLKLVILDSPSNIMLRKNVEVHIMIYSLSSFNVKEL